MSDFLTILRSGRVLLMDGAMGTELQNAGLRVGECQELWNLTQPAKVRGVHQAYVEAGVECLLTNTFQANQKALARHGLASQWAEIQQAATANARAAGGPECFVLADLGPDIGVDLPLGQRATYAEFIQLCGAVDGVLLETVSNRDDLIALLFIRNEMNRVPFLFSPTYGRNAAGLLCTCVGHYAENKPPEFYAERARDWNVDVLGVNCGRDIGMDETIEIVRRYRQVTDLPLFVRPNAGTPRWADDHWIYPRTCAAMARRLPELLEAGANMIGGCCGTTPEYIAAFKSIIDAWNHQHGFIGEKG